MKSLKILGGVLAALSLAAVAPAQTGVSTNGGSLLGSRYAELGFGYINVNNSAVDGFGTSAVVNFPMVTGVDLSVGFNHGWVEAHSDITTDLLAVSATAYRDFAGVTGFATLTVGHQWTDVIGDDFLWGARLGGEFVLSETTALLASVGYDDDFDSGLDGLFDGELRLNVRVSEKLTPYLSASLIEGGSIGGEIGLAFKF